MNDILDQNEVDALLKGVDNGDVETETNVPSQDSEDMTYDLTNPEKIIRGKMQGLNVVHDKFLKQFQNSLSSFLRMDVSLSLLSFEVMKYVRFIETIPLPASLCILNVEPNNRAMILQMDAVFVFSIMDILCGGDGNSRFKVEGREFTSIELKIIDRVANLALADLALAWKPVVPFTFSLKKTEMNPRFVTAVERTETLLVFDFEVSIEQVNCCMKICIPYSTIEPYRADLSGEVHTAKIVKQDGKASRWLQQNLKEMEINVVGEMGQGEMTFRDLMHLKVGDIIELNKTEEDPLIVLCEGVGKFKGLPGQHKGHMAIQVLSPI